MGEHQEGKRNTPSSFCSFVARAREATPVDETLWEGEVSALSPAQSIFSKRPPLRGSEPLFTGAANLDLTTPFRLEHLRRRDTTSRVGIEDRVDDISTPGLEWNSVSRFDSR